MVFQFELEYDSNVGIISMMLNTKDRC
jgi:hypothetical protein